MEYLSGQDVLAGEGRDQKRDARKQYRLHSDLSRQRGISSLGELCEWPNDLERPEHQEHKREDIYQGKLLYLFLTGGCFCR